MSTQNQGKLNEDTVNLYTDLYECMRDSISYYFNEYLEESCYIDELASSNDGMLLVQNYFEEFLVSLLGDIEKHLIRDANDLSLTGNTYNYTDYCNLSCIEFAVAKTTMVLKKENKFSLKGYVLGCQETINHVNRLNILTDVPQFIVSLASTLSLTEEEFSEIIAEHYDTMLPVPDKYVANLLEKFTEELIKSTYKNLLVDYYCDDVDGLEEFISHLTIGRTTLDQTVLIELLTKYSPMWNNSTLTDYAKDSAFISRFEKILANRSDKVYKEHFIIFEYFVGISKDRYLQNSTNTSSYTDTSYWLCHDEEKIAFNTFSYFLTMALIALNLFNNDNMRGLTRFVEVHSYLADKYLQQNSH